MIYQIVKDLNNPLGQTISLIRDDGTITSIPPEKANTDYQAFLAWIAEGNAPLPPDEPPAETE